MAGLEILHLWLDHWPVLGNTIPSLMWILVASCILHPHVKAIMRLPVINHNKWTLKITCLRRHIILQTFIDWFHISFQKYILPLFPFVCALFIWGSWLPMTWWCCEFPTRKVVESTQWWSFCWWKITTKTVEYVHQPKIGGRCRCIIILCKILDTLNSLIVMYRYMCIILQKILCLSSQTLKKKAIVLMFQSGHLPPFFPP